MKPETKAGVPRTGVRDKTKGTGSSRALLVKKRRCLSAGFFAGVVQHLADTVADDNIFTGLQRH